MDAAELEWIAWTTPITTSLGTALAASDFSGRTVACRQHILADTICIVTPFVEAGARVRLAPCNPDSTDDRAVAHLASIGVEVRARAGMSAGELDESLAWLVSEPADALCDMGGDLIAAAAAAGHRPAGALEATTTGLHRLDGLEIPFPVLDWNGIALKDLIHNRHHVGVETWPAFTAITGLALYGREVVVVGFGPVGQGVAARARDLGAVVTVVDLDPVRLVQAQHDGCRVAEMAAALRTASVIVTATGFDGVLGERAAVAGRRRRDPRQRRPQRPRDRRRLARPSSEHPDSTTSRALRARRSAGVPAQSGQPRQPRRRARDRCSPAVRSVRGDHAARARCHPERADRRSAQRRAALPGRSRPASPGRSSRELRTDLERAALRTRASRRQAQRSIRPTRASRRQAQRADRERPKRSGGQSRSIRSARSPASLRAAVAAGSHRTGRARSGRCGTRRDGRRCAVPRGSPR